MDVADWLVLTMTTCCIAFLAAGAHLRFDLVRTRWQERVRGMPPRARRRGRESSRA